MPNFPCIETKTFLAFVADNSGVGIHRAGYNGVASLVSKASGNNLFVPTFAGMNYETIRLAGMPFHEKKFEPRFEPMRVEGADANSVVLVQPETSHSHVGARITFTVEEPCYLHQRIELMLHRRFGHGSEPDRFESLWASYVHQPPDVHAYLKGDIALGDDLSGWVGVTRPSHMSHDWRIKPLPEDDAVDAAGHLDAMQKAGYLLGNDMTGRIKGSWSADALPKMLTGPLHFYYGLCHDDTMLLMMFREPERFRFAYSPEGGGTEPARSPAWDYLLTLDDAKVGAKYVWNLCLAVKRFAGRADVLREVKRYHSTR